jgi:hypothetical protein
MSLLQIGRDLVAVSVMLTTILAGSMVNPRVALFRSARAKPLRLQQMPISCDRCLYLWLFAQGQRAPMRPVG